MLNKYCLCLCLWVTCSVYGSHLATGWQFLDSTVFGIKKHLGSPSHYLPEPMLKHIKTWKSAEILGIGNIKFFFHLKMSSTGTRLPFHSNLNVLSNGPWTWRWHCLGKVSWWTTSFRPPFLWHCRWLTNFDYRQISNISCTKSQTLNVSCLVWQLPLTNPLKPGMKSRMKMGDAPTTSEWSIILLPTRVRLILEVLRYFLFPNWRKNNASRSYKTVVHVPPLRY